MALPGISILIREIPQLTDGMLLQVREARTAPDGISILIHDGPQLMDGVLPHAIKISDPKIAQELTALDRNGDGVISPGDFHVYDPQGMFDAITRIIDSVVYFSPKQRFGFWTLLNVYKAVHEFDEATNKLSLCQPMLDIIFDEREFDADCWRYTVLPAVEKGPLSYSALSYIAENLPLISYLMGDGWLYKEKTKEEALPEVAKPIVSAMLDAYERSASWYFHSNKGACSYYNEVEEIECEGFGCPEEDEINIEDIPHLCFYRSPEGTLSFQPRPIDSNFRMD